MKQCEKCAWYEKEYDELISSGDDVIIEGEEPVEKHYCHKFCPFNYVVDDGILVEPKTDCISLSVVEYKEDCIEFFSREEAKIGFWNAKSK